MEIKAEYSYLPLANIICGKIYVLLENIYPCWAVAILGQKTQLSKISVLLLCGKPEGKPSHGCPFCNIASPYDSTDYQLYTIGDLYTWHQVVKYSSCISIIFLTEIFGRGVQLQEAEKLPECGELPTHHWPSGQVGSGSAEHSISPHSDR